MLSIGDVVLVETGDDHPADGEVIEGVAAVDESAVTGESAPVVREAGGDRSVVLGGTRLVSDWLKVRVAADPGKTFYDSVLALIEGARREGLPSQLRWTLPLTLLALVVAGLSALLLPLPDRFVFFIALSAALAPTTIAAVQPAIGIAGRDWLVRANVIAKSGR